ASRTATCDLCAALETEFRVLGIFGRARYSASGSALRKLFEQRLRGLQVGRVEAFGEPAIDLGERLSCFLASSARPVNSSQRNCKNERSHPRTLPPSNLDAPPEMNVYFLKVRSRAAPRKQPCPRRMDPRLVCSRTAPLHELPYLLEDLQAPFHSTDHPVRSRYVEKP